jgi:hypothetical protein
VFSKLAFEKSELEKLDPEMFTSINSASLKEQSSNSDFNIFDLRKIDELNFEFEKSQLSKLLFFKLKLVNSAPINLQLCMFEELKFS